MTNSTETASIVSLVNQPNIKMQLDTGAITINKEDIGEVLENFKSLIGHIHLSEPNLIPLGDSVTNHALYHEEIQKNLTEDVATIEMVATQDEPHINSITRAIVQAKRNYT